MFFASLTILGHAGKNAGGQVSSCIRTIFLGKHWVDLAGSYMNGMPAKAFMRIDQQSDCLQAFLACPWYYVCNMDGDPSMLSVNWSNKGALLWSLSTALCVAPSLHKGLTVKERAECALSGFLAWDLWQLTAARKESQEGARVGEYSMAAVKVENLQNVCLSVLTILLTKPAT